MWLSLITGFALEAFAVSPDQAFRAYEDQHFYLFSQTRPAGFSCLMDLNTISTLVDGLKSKSESGALPMTVKDSLPSFGVKYVRLEDKLEFNRPSLSLSIKDGTPIPNPAAVRAGMDQIFRGFNHQVESAIGTAQGLLHEFLISRHDVIHDVAFETTANGYTAAFSMDGGNTKTEFDGRVKQSRIRIGDQEINAKAFFDKGPNGKLVLIGAEVIQSEGTMRMEYSTQTIDGLVLPETIEMSVVSPSTTANSNAGFQIRFFNCSVE